MKVWTWAEPCHNVPSPPAGEGQGGGYDTHGVRLVPEAQKISAIVLESVHRINFPLSASLPPPSLSLPHKGLHSGRACARPGGGGNRVARALATRRHVLADGMC